MFYYVATPYSKFPYGIEAAYREACRQAAYLIRAKVPAFSPIAHTHGLAIEGNIDPLSHEIWLAADAPFMAAAGGLIVVMMEGWDTSYGVAHEIEAFKAAGKQIVYMWPDVVPAELLK